MLSDFYQAHSKRILLVVAITFPVLSLIAESLVSNNDIETWLPENSPVRVSYDEFRELFGNEEIVVIGLPGRNVDDPLVEGIRARIDRLPQIRHCHSPSTLGQVMADFGVPEDEIDQRLERLVVSTDGSMIALVAMLSEDGRSHRELTVEAIRHELDYCQIEDEDCVLAGAPIVVCELDRLGSQENGKFFFIISLFISLLLLQLNIRQWNISLSLLGITVWGINLTLSMVYICGFEMNFLLGALSVMVMVFTLAVCIHFVHYYRSSGYHSNPLQMAFRLAWKPSLLATATTTIGLVSLGVSDIGPVREFGYFAGMGAVVAFLCGLGLTPAILTVMPLREKVELNGCSRFDNIVHWILDRRFRVAVSCIAVVCVAGLGLGRISTRINPLDFLPRDSKVLNDVLRVERDLANTSSVEAVVDLGEAQQPFATRLQRIREIHRKIDALPAVQHTMSLASFFPEQLPSSSMEVASLLSKAQAQQADNSFVAVGERYWRISARISSDSEHDRDHILTELREVTAGEPIQFTGIAPLLQHAQDQIFAGFWESFAMAFVVISIVMIASLRSLKVGLLAMIPNLTPICLVFGMLGWLRIPVDIGMMMTGSIALGIAVDGTFHYLVRYREDLTQCGDSAHAARVALLRTGLPIFTAAAVAAVGMLGLSLSDFAPTARFGYMMAAMLMAALVGDLVLLPVLLTLRRSATRVSVVPQPHLGQVHPHTAAAYSSAPTPSINASRLVE